MGGVAEGAGPTKGAGAGGGKGRRCKRPLTTHLGEIVLQRLRLLADVYLGLNGRKLVPNDGQQQLEQEE